MINIIPFVIGLLAITSMLFLIVRSVWFIRLWINRDFLTEEEYELIFEKGMNKFFYPINLPSALINPIADNQLRKVNLFNWISIFFGMLTILTIFYLFSLID